MRGIGSAIRGLVRSFGINRIIPKEIGSPLAPLNLVAVRSVSTPSSIMLTWQDYSTSESTFTIMRKASDTGIWSTISITQPAKIGRGQICAFTDTHRSLTISYSYQVFASNTKFGTGSGSNITSPV